MVVKCIKNKLAQIDDELIKKSLRNVNNWNDEIENGCTLGKLYTVFGINFNFGDSKIPYYYLCENIKDTYPTPEAAVFFEIIDPRASRYWEFVYNWNKDTAIGLYFSEWAKNGIFYEKLVDGGKKEELIFSEYKKLMDAEVNS